MSGDLTPAYYLVGIAGTTGAGLLAIRSYLAKMRKDYMAEGHRSATASDALEANTRGQERNTTAVERLTQEIHDLALKTEERFNAVNRRIDRLDRNGGDARERR